MAAAIAVAIIAVLRGDAATDDQRKGPPRGFVVVTAIIMAAIAEALRTALAIALPVPAVTHAAVFLVDAALSGLAQIVLIL